MTPKEARAFARNASERIEPSGEEAEMKFAMLRMAEIVKHFLGERHPLAEAASANAVPA